MILGKALLNASSLLRGGRSTASAVVCSPRFLRGPPRAAPLSPSAGPAGPRGAPFLGSGCRLLGMSAPAAAGPSSAQSCKRDETCRYKPH